jgi:hypothetical protein
MKTILLATAAAVIVSTSAQAQQNDPRLPKACFEQYDASDVQFCNDAKKRLGLVPLTAEDRKASLEREITAEMPVMCIGPQPTVSEKFRQKEPGLAKTLDAAAAQRDQDRKPFCDQQRAQITARIEARRKAEEEQAKRLEEARLQQIEQKRPKCVSDFIATTIDKANRAANLPNRTWESLSDQQKNTLKGTAEAECKKPGMAEGVAQIRQEIEAAKPINQLRFAYARYSYIQNCYNIRLGYLAVWINDVELQRAKDAVTRREKMLLEQDQTIDTTAVWNAVQANKPQLYYDHECRQHYRDLLLSVPALQQQKNFGN